MIEVNDFVELNNPKVYVYRNVLWIGDSVVCVVSKLCWTTYLGSMVWDFSVLPKHQGQLWLPTQPPINWVLGVFSPGIMWPGHEADHSLYPVFIKRMSGVVPPLPQVPTGYVLGQISLCFTCCVDLWKVIITQPCSAHSLVGSVIWIWDGLFFVINGCHRNMRKLTVKSRLGWNHALKL
jgi:hypothetical protein